MGIAVFSILIALFLGYGAVGEFIVPGLKGGQTQPLLMGLIGIIVNLLLVTSAIALWRRWPSARMLTVIAAVSLIAFHVYGALPPHRNVGILVMLVAVAYGLILLGYTVSARGLKSRLDTSTTPS